MKKLFSLALVAGALFVASCNNKGAGETTTTDSTATPTDTTMQSQTMGNEMAGDSAKMGADSTKMDNMMSGDSSKMKMETKTTTKMEEKKTK